MLIDEALAAEEDDILGLDYDPLEEEEKRCHNRTFQNRANGLSRTSTVIIRQANVGLVMRKESQKEQETERSQGLETSQDAPQT